MSKLTKEQIEGLNQVWLERRTEGMDTSNGDFMSGVCSALFAAGIDIPPLFIICTMSGRDPFTGEAI